MAIFASERALMKVQEAAHALTGSPEDYDPLIKTTLISAMRALRKWASAAN
jgi:hypothetical protein